MKTAARLLAILGAVAVGALLFRSNPRDVVLVYDLAAVKDADVLGVQITRGQEMVRTAQFRGPAAQVRHAVQLPDGTYHLRWGIDRRSGPPVLGERDITVQGSETIVLSLAP